MGGRILKFSAVLAILGLVVAAVIVKGFEHGDIKLNTQNLWILHKTPLSSGAPGGGSSAYYGQVNTGLSELTSINSVAKKPEAIHESDFGAIITELGDVSYVDINLASPADYASESKDFKPTAGTTSVSLAGNLLVFGGEKSIRYTQIVEGVTAEPKTLGKPEGVSDTPGYAAASSSTAGLIYTFSAATKKVYTFDTNANTWVGSGEDVSGATDGEFQITSIGDSWVLLDAKSGKVWVKGSASSRQLANQAEAKLQAPAASGEFAYVSTTQSVFSVKLGSGDVKEVAKGSGKNARPVSFENSVYAGWLGSASGSIVNCVTGESVQLDGFDKGGGLGTEIDPVIQTNGVAAVLNDAQSGWAWNIPDGKVIPSTQDWQSKIVPPPPVVTGGEAAKKPEPPVAEDDTFGARAGVLTTLPALLNDHDPNPEDVLTIDPDSVTGFDETKGVLRIAADGQSFSLLAKGTARGSLSFSYRVSDGSQANGMKSKNAATVTVNFQGEATNSPPVWCDEAPTPCTLRNAPDAQVLPGQSVTVPFLEGFIDPEGDKTFISATSLTSGTGTVGFTSRGEVVFRSNLSKGSSEVANVLVTVSDVRGATVTKNLSVNVNPNTPLSFKPFVVTAIAGETKVVDILRGVRGAVGQVEIAADPKSSARATLAKVGPTLFSVTSETAQQIQVVVSFGDENGEPINGYVQVNFIEDTIAKVAASPVTVLVRPGLDSTVDLYSAISNPSERSLLITLEKPEKVGKSSLVAGKVKGGFVRVRGRTEDDSPGLVGRIRYQVTDGTGDPSYQAEGQIFVYQLATPTTNPIGVDDAITLKTESTGDVDVLANDVGTPGISLKLDAKSVTCKGTGFDEAGGIVFAAHGVIRVVAPTKKGAYHCNYIVQASDAPSQTGSAGLLVNVKAPGNLAPIPPTIKARVTSVAPIEIPINLNGIDPDGDSVELVSARASDSPKGYPAVSAKGNSIIYTVIPGEEGQDSFTYTVTDGAHESTGIVKVGIFANSSNDGPVTMVDIVDLVANTNSKAVFDPTANDYDPNPNAKTRGLTLLVDQLMPNLPAGTKAYTASAAMITAPAEGSRLVTITAPKEAGEYEFVYAVRDAYGSQAQGLIVVRVTKNAVPDQPEVTDTYVTADERALLATRGIDVVSRKVTWLTGDIGQLKLSIVGNAHGFRVSGKTSLIGTPTAAATFVVFKLTGTDFAGQPAETYGILHIPRENKVISLKDAAAVWEIDEGKTAEQDLLDWIAVAPGARLEIDSAKVSNSNSRPEASCKFVSGTKVSYSSGTGGKRFNDVCVVPIRYVGEKLYTDISIRIHIRANKPTPVFTNVTVEVMPGSSATLDLSSMVTWDTENPTWDWQVTKRSGSSIKSTGPDSNVMTFEVVLGSEAFQEDQFEIRIAGQDTFGLVTVIVGESPNAKPSGTLTFDAQNGCDIKAGKCELHIDDLSAVVNALDTKLKFTPIGYKSGTPNYKIGDVLQCGAVSIQVTDENTVTATWSVKSGAPASQICPSMIAPGALLDGEGKKGTLKIIVDIKGVPRAPRKVEQVGYTESTVTLRITATDFAADENRVTEYVVYEGKRLIPVKCTREGTEAFTTCDPIEDLRPYHGSDEANSHSYSVTAKNPVGESAAYLIHNVYAYEKLRGLTSGIFKSVVTVSGRETAKDMGVAEVTLNPVKDPLVAKYVVRGEGGARKEELIINGDYKERTFQISARPGYPVAITVTAEGAIKPPVNGVMESATAEYRTRISGTASLGSAKAEIVGNSAPYHGVITVSNVNRNFSKKSSHAAFIFYPDSSSEPECTYDSKTYEITVAQVPGILVQKIDDAWTSDDVIPALTGDVSGLLQNVSYKSKVCYTNGFGLGAAGIKQVAPSNSVSTIADPNEGDFEYTVELASKTQSTVAGQPLFAWVVKLAKAPTMPAGMKAQFSSAKTGVRWEDTIYSDYWNERPVIKVRYCNQAATICSAGETLVRPQNDAKSWQLRITRAFLTTADANMTERPTCAATRPLELGFGVAADGFSSWLGAKVGEIEVGMFKAEYQLQGTTTWVEMDDSRRTFFRLKTGVGTVTALRFWFQPDTSTTSGLEKIQVVLNVTC